MTVTIKRAKFLRAFVFTATGTPAGNDTDFSIVDSEDSIELQSKRNIQKYTTKGHGIIKSGGEIDASIKLSAQAINPSDTGLAAIRTAYASGNPLAFQVRDVEVSPNLVAMEGICTVAEFTQKMDANGLVEYTITLEVSGDVIQNVPARALTGSGS